MAGRTTGITNSLEGILNNPNVNTHPRLAVFLTDYADAIAAGYTPTQQVLDAILELSPTSEAAIGALDSLITQLADSGFISRTIIQNTTLFGPLIGTNFADFISVQTTDDFGIYVENSVFDLRGGNNIITASSRLVGIYNLTGSIFNLGDGDNIITASGGDGGIFNLDNSTFSLGNGNNTITASGDDMYGIYTFSTFRLGDGNNRITASGGFSGISNNRNSTFSLGNGNNTIIASGDTFGIYNLGTISLGDGNNTIIASGRSGGITNFGTISTGAGNDVIDALTGSINNVTGIIDLGAGDDTLKGHGTGIILGGEGIDTLIFAEGIYNIVEVGEDRFRITFPEAFFRSGTYDSFEWIGGTSGDLLTLAAGTLEVTAAGASYI